MGYPQSCKHRLPKIRLHVHGPSEKLAIILPKLARLDMEMESSASTWAGKGRKSKRRFYLSNVSGRAATGCDGDRNGVQEGCRPFKQSGGVVLPVCS